MSNREGKQKTRQKKYETSKNKNRKRQENVKESTHESDLRMEKENS